MRKSMMSNPTHDDRAGTAAAGAAAVLVLGLAACGDDAESDSRDFAVAHLESGPGAFAAEQRKQAKEEEDEEGSSSSPRLEGVGLEADYVSQFFSTSRNADLSFAESIAFLFEDEAAAEEAVGVVSEASAENLGSAEAIEAPDLGEQPLGSGASSTASSPTRSAGG
jgi:hypothetical protein